MLVRRFSPLQPGGAGWKTEASSGMDRPCRNGLGGGADCRLGWDVPDVGGRLAFPRPFPVFSALENGLAWGPGNTAVPRGGACRTAPEYRFSGRGHFPAQRFGRAFGRAPYGYGKGCLTIT
ncbi:MAG TPA: hypothetical protein DD422_06390 [Akkermansia sp.]|nr:hypothetical protein [Akkermansia sp.]